MAATFCIYKNLIMTIDKGTIFTAIFFLLLFSIPFILLYISRRTREKRNLQLLTREAAKNNLQVSTFNTWGNTSIGMDEAANVVFFSKKTTNGETGHQVALAETEKCRVSTIKRTQSNEDGNYTLTDKLELVFEPADKKKMETAFTFFNVDHDGAILTGELQQAEKWCSIINDKIASIAQKK
jgi:hypothetical protein